MPETVTRRQFVKRAASAVALGAVAGATAVTGAKAPQPADFGLPATIFGCPVVIDETLRPSREIVLGGPLID